MPCSAAAARPRGRERACNTIHALADGPAPPHNTELSHNRHTTVTRQTLSSHRAHLSSRTMSEKAGRSSGFWAQQRRSSWVYASSPAKVAVSGPGRRSRAGTSRRPPPSTRLMICRNSQLVRMNDGHTPTQTERQYAPGRGWSGSRAVPACTTPRAPRRMSTRRLRGPPSPQTSPRVPGQGRAGQGRAGQGSSQRQIHQSAAVVQGRALAAADGGMTFPRMHAHGRQVA